MFDLDAVGRADDQRRGLVDEEAVFHDSRYAIEPCFELHGVRDRVHQPVENVMASVGLEHRSLFFPERRDAVQRPKLLGGLRPAERRHFHGNGHGLAQHRHAFGVIDQHDERARRGSHDFFPQ